MSVIGDLGQNMSRLPKILELFDNDLEHYEQNLKIKGKLLGEALKEQPTWSAYYGERAIELSTLSKYIEGQVKKVRAGFTRTYNENYNPALSERMLEKYIDGEDVYLNIFTLYLEVKELTSKYELVVEAFNRRGFALRDITLSHVHDIQGVSL
jgi:hypothetical protein